MTIYIDIINRSTILTNTEVKKMVSAINTQIRRDFYPAWGIKATLRMVSSSETPSPNNWWIAILDNSDQAGALGYHDITDTGLPLGKVFAKDVIGYGLSPSVTLSHEVLEMLGDPEVNLLVAGAGNRRFYPYEMCDPVESDKDGYLINDVLVSNFILPAYFELSNRHGPYDFMKKLSAPFPAMSDGGYLAYMDSLGNWHQIFASQKKPSAGLRRALRLKTRESWVRSLAHSRG